MNDFSEVPFCKTSQTIQRNRIGEPKTKSEITENEQDEEPSSPKCISDMLYRSNRLAKFEKELKKGKKPSSDKKRKSIGSVNDDDVYEPLRRFKKSIPVETQTSRIRPPLEIYPSLPIIKAPRPELKASPFVFEPPPYQLPQFAWPTPSTWKPFQPTSEYQQHNPYYMTQENLASYKNFYDNREE